MRFGLNIVFACFLAAGIPAPAQAFQATQPTTTSPATTKPSEVAADELSVESIEARIKLLETSVDLNEAAKAKAIDYCKQAIDNLKAAQQSTARAEQFTRLRADAPAELAQLKEELAEPPDRAKPEAPPEASLTQLEQFLAQATAELQKTKADASSLEDEQKNRDASKKKTPEIIADAKSRLDKTVKEFSDEPESQQPPQVNQSALLMKLARKRAIESEIAAYEQELLSYDARGDLLTAQHDVAVRKAARAEKLVKGWQEIVNKRRREQAEIDARAAEKARLDAARANPVLKELAEENADTAEKRKRAKIPDKIEQTTRKQDAITNALAKLDSDFISLDEKVGAVGLTHTMGLLLRKQRDDLPNIRVHERDLAARQEEISETQLRLMDIKEHLSGLAKIDDLVIEKMSHVDASLSRDERRSIRRAVRELYKTRKELLSALRSDYDAYSTALVLLNVSEQKLINRIKEFKEYIDQRILWVRSTTPPTTKDIARAWEALLWLVRPAVWVQIGNSLWTTLLADPIPDLIALPPLIFLFLVNHRMRRKLREIGESAASSRARSFLPTIIALIFTVLIAVRWALLFYYLAWRLESALDAPDLAKVTAAGLRSAAPVLFLISLTRQLFRANGLAEAHFGWPKHGAKLIRLNSLWVTMIAVPAAFILGAIEWTTDTNWHNSLGRLAFVVGQTVAAILSYRLLRPVGGVLQEHMADHPEGWLRRTRLIWYPLSVGIPVVLMLLSILGYYYTAVRLSAALLQTTWIILALVIFNGLSLRWLMISHRNIAIEQLRKRREAAQQQAAADGKAVESADAPPAEEVNLPSISAQTRNLLRSFVIFTFFCGLWLVWSEMLPALRFFDHYKLWTPEGAATVTATDVIMAIVTIIVAFIAARNLPGLLEIMLLNRLPMDQAARYATTTLARYVIMIVGLALTFGRIGISWSSVQWLAAAVTVGLGFGLQEIVANFVSGIIILFERPIRIGDLVTTGGVDGRVTRIRMRATTIMDSERRELLVPNKELITGRVLNWTLSDSITRIHVPVLIAYGEDTERARNLLLKIAIECDVVLADPAPQAIFTDFTADGLKIDLYVYLPSRDAWAEAMHEVHTRIIKSFMDAGIEFAFPKKSTNTFVLDTAAGVKKEEPPRGDGKAN